jgi:hypothetical protein
MNEFVTDREALDYLAARIAAEAERDGTPLSEVERKMLYFSETDWTLPDMAGVSAEFDRDYDEDQYERKIAGLIRKIEADSHGHNQEEQETWDAAVYKLSDGDRYLLVMLSSSFSPLGRATRPPHDRLKLWLTAFGIVFGAFALMALGNWLFGPRFWTVMGWIFGDRNRFGFIVICAVLVWVFRAKLREVFSIFLHRE